MLKRLAILALLVFAVPSNGSEKISHSKGDKNAKQEIQPSTTIIEVQQQAPTDKANSPKDAPEGFIARHVPPEKVTNFGLFVIGLLGVIAAGFTLRAIRDQANKMEGQLAEMRKVSEIENKTLILQYRPKIIVRNANVKDFSDDVGEGIFSEPVRCVVAFQIANTGGSPAHVVDGDIYLMSARLDNPEGEIEFKESTHVSIGPRTLQPGERESIECGLDTGIPNDSRWIEIQKGASSHSLFLLGTIWYRDNLNIPRQTGINRKYDPKNKRFNAQKDSEEEYSD